MNKSPAPIFTAGLLAAAFAAPALVSTAQAQRENLDLGWQKRQLVISYGAVPVGKHGLHELPVGRTWRMGFNRASTLFTELPLWNGKELVAPGGYRVKLAHTKKALRKILKIRIIHYVFSP